MNVDLAVIGAGTAGAAVALHAARAGLAVVLVERRARDQAGARWVNGVTGAQLDLAGIARPVGEELRGAGHAFHILVGWGPRRISVARHDVLDVDMRGLVARLQRDAVAAGARLWDDTEVVAVTGRDVDTSRGPLRAGWIVDATGLAGVDLLRSPTVAPLDLCSAAQEVRRVLDRRAAEQFFARHEVPAGDTLCFTSVAGGFSVVNVRLMGDELSILTGSIVAQGNPSGRRLIDDFATREAWVGPAIFGGARAIPVRRPHDVLARDHVAAIGDAACQVFSPHGSGIGPGLVAARLLVEALVRGDGPAGYGWAWHRKYGGLFAGYDAFRRFSQSLTADELGRLVDAGIVDLAITRAGLEQRLPRLADGPSLSPVLGLAREPRLARRIAPVLAKMSAAFALYARYPADPAELPAWSARAARALGA